MERDTSISFSSSAEELTASVKCQNDIGAASESLDGRNDSIFHFVEAGWFQCVSAVVILGNTVMMFLEMDDESLEETLFFPDQATMCFYIFELACRILYFRGQFMCGKKWPLCWNMLDVTVVIAGIFDQWVLPNMHVDDDSPIGKFVCFLRLLRIARVLKIFRVFLETDLSWTERPAFQSFIGAVIGFNAALMGFETDIPWAGWSYIEQVLLVVYVFELLVRLKRDGLHFLACSNPDITWNALDFSIVVSSAADSWLVPMGKILSKQFINSQSAGHKVKGMSMSQIMMLMRMLRLMRILRLVKLVKSVRPLYILVTGVIAAFQGVVWVLVLTIVTLYAAGILATRLLGHGLLFPMGTPVPKGVWVFKTVPDSMFTLFRVMSGSQSDDEAMAIEELMVTLPVVKFAFIFFMVTSSWTLLSILTAVVSENMITTTATQNEELQMASDDEDRNAHIQELKDLFNSIPQSKISDGTRSNRRVCDASPRACDEKGKIGMDDITEFLKDKQNALKTAKVCRVAARNVKEVLKTLGSDGEPVSVDRFVEAMVDVGNPVVEQSMRKIETLFKESKQKFEDGRRMVEKEFDAWCKQHEEEVEAQEGSGHVENLLEELAEQQRASSQALSQLHESFQRLLGSQEILMQQSAESERRTANLEAALANLQNHCSSELRSCEADILNLRQARNELLAQQQISCNN